MQEAPHWTSADLAPRIRTTRQAAFTCVLAVLSGLSSAGLCVAAMVLHPPIGVVPLLVLACVGCPVFGTWELPHAVVVLRDDSKRRAIEMFRRSLDELPETNHPLGH